MQQLIGEEDLVRACYDRETFDPPHRAWVAADKTINEFLKMATIDLAPGEERTYMVEGYDITAKAAKKTSYEIPDDVKAKYRSTGVSIRKHIQTTTGTKPHDE